jgi:hypothetical protein
MRRSLPLAILLATTLAGLAPPARAEQPDAKSTDVEPGAIAALERMGAYLRGLKAFEVRAQTATEEVLDDGMKVTFSGIVNLVAATPNRLRVEVASDRQERLYLYDGRAFTLFARRVNYYATVPAPPTITELANDLEDKYDIEIPLVDLFRWGGPRATTSHITVATDLGPSVVDGTTCEHYAFRQPGLDWQLWVQLGEYPLPRKLVLTTMTDEARPQHGSVYAWNLAPSFGDSAFTFAPPEGARKIVFAAASR